MENPQLLYTFESDPVSLDTHLAYNGEQPRGWPWAGARPIFGRQARVHPARPHRAWRNHVRQGHAQRMDRRIVPSASEPRLANLAQTVFFLARVAWHRPAGVASDLLGSHAHRDPVAGPGRL